MLISLWSLNKRIDSLICFIFSTNKNGIVLNNLNFSYKTFCEILFPSIVNSSLLSSNIKYIYFQGTKSIAFDFLYQNIFYHNEKQNNPFPNLESLHMTRCLLSQSLIETLSFLIQHHSKQLTLTFNEDIYESFHYGPEFMPIDSIQGN
ncbi:hypothetical protein I4U23_003383 [Adineta vaga]|nr:hypothetical protein I4U23_003383 [Adineta vaga]